MQKNPYLETVVNGGTCFYFYPDAVRQPCNCACRACWLWMTHMLGRHQEHGKKVAASGYLQSPAPKTDLKALFAGAPPAKVPSGSRSAAC